MSRISKYLFVILAFALAACDNGGDDPALPTSPQIMISFGGDAIEVWQEVVSRDGSLPAPKNAEITSVGVFAVNNSGTVFDNRQFFDPAKAPDVLLTWSGDYDKDAWPYAPLAFWAPGADYEFAAYAPYSSGDMTLLAGDGGVLSGFVREGLSSISAADIMVSNCFGHKAVGSNNPTIGMTLKHLMARLRFCFKLHEEYAEIRTVRVKRMKVSYPDSRSMTLYVSYSKSGAEYVSSYRWERGETGTGDDTVTLSNEPGVDHIDLKKGDVDFQPLASLYYEPGDPLSMFNIEVFYDVYDTAGLLLRENDHAVSAITMLRTLDPGKYYDVKIKIKPSYLYVLSDNDLDHDGELIIK